MEAILWLRLPLTVLPKGVKTGNKSYICLCGLSRSNSFTVWDISFILQKLLHSSMIPFPLNRGVTSLNLHEYGMADVSTASIFFSRHTIPCSLICYHTSVGIRSDYMSYSTSSYSQLLSDLLYGYRTREILLLQFFARTVVALSVSFIQHL